MPDRRLAARPCTCASFLALGEAFIVRSSGLLVTERLKIIRRQVMGPSLIKVNPWCIATETHRMHGS